MSAVVHVPARHAEALPLFTAVRANERAGAVDSAMLASYVGSACANSVGDTMTDHLGAKSSIALRCVLLAGETQRGSSSRCDVVEATRSNGIMLSNEMTFCPVQIFGGESLKQRLPFEGSDAVLLDRPLDCLPAAEVGVTHHLSVVGLTDVHHPVLQVSGQVDQSVGLHSSTSKITTLFTHQGNLASINPLHPLGHRA